MTLCIVIKFPNSTIIFLRQNFAQNEIKNPPITKGGLIFIEKDRSYIL